MRVLKVGMGRIAVLLAVLTALALSTGVARAADPEKKEEKTYPFIAMNGKPWSAVWKWLTEETGKEVINTSGPVSSTFSFTGPEKKSYTLPDVIDLINAGLLANSPTAKFCLINGDHQFFVVSADEKIDPSYLPHIDGPEDFKNHGDTEYVKMELPLTSLNAEDMALRLGPVMGPFHDLVALPGNELYMVDTVRNLKHAVQTLKKIEESDTKQTDSYSHVCKYIQARDAEKYLRALLGEPQTVQEPAVSERERERGGASAKTGRRWAPRRARQEPRRWDLPA